MYVTSLGNNLGAVIQVYPDMLPLNYMEWYDT